jgi:hypothetical protein
MHIGDIMRRPPNKKTRVSFFFDLEESVPYNPTTKWEAKRKKRNPPIP